MNKSNSILTKGQTIDNKYSISFFLKKGDYAQTYRVQNQSKETKLLKLFDYAKLHRTQFTESGDILEIEILKQIKHPNLVKYNDSGDVILNNQKFAYVVLDFISGETLADRMKREQQVNPYEAKEIILGVLNGLNYLHSQKIPIIHNDITNSNVMLDLSGKIAVAKIIDFGHARFLNQSNKDFQKEGLNPFYSANETFNNVFSAQSDIFSVGALFYHLIFGMPPYFIELSQYKSDRIKLEDAILAEREKPLKIPNTAIKIDDNLINIIIKALRPQAENRFQNVQEFIQALNGEIQVETAQSANQKRAIKPKKTKSGEGFRAIAGMTELKEQLKNDVIDLINDPEGAEQYNISMPNGMLMYGPPGCGKTFFAEKFAEETGFGYKYINPSELASIYVHGTQEKIGNLFNEAKQNAPFIICLDEVSSIFPKRENAGHHQIGEVDEFLTQLNNCGQEGVFVIALTNFPENIDEAVLRAGRLDIKIYVSPPDFEARKEMFKMFLEKIPTDFGIDYDKLANLTENFASSEIAFVVDNVARKLRKDRKKASMEHLENEIQQRQALSGNTLMKFSRIKDGFESGKEVENERKRIGFKL